MTVHNGWSRAKSFSLDREGFAMREFHTPFTEWDDDNAIRARLYGDVEEFIKRDSWR